MYFSKTLSILDLPLHLPIYVLPFHKSMQKLFYFFHAIGNYSVMFHSIKNAPRRSALRRKRSMSLKRPAAGGESRKRDSLFYLSNIQFGSWNGVSTYTFENVKPYSKASSLDNIFFAFFSCMIYLTRTEICLLFYKGCIISSIIPSGSLK